MGDEGMKDFPAGSEPTGRPSQEGSAPSSSLFDSHGPARKSRPRELIFVVVAILLVLGLAEVLLRLTGFRFLSVPQLIVSTWGPEQLDAMNEGLGSNVFQPDDLLFWSMFPGARLDVRQVNELGLLNGPVEIPKPTGVYRILCLGDSCTAMGPIPYSLALQKCLNLTGQSDRRFEVINAGVFAYTSLQGLRLFRDRLGDTQPDLVTICYGWNDHYLTEGYPDKLLRSREAPAPGMLRLLRRMRLYQLARRIVQAAQAPRTDEPRVRVAPEDYRDNLRAMLDRTAETGARAILLTAPSNHSLGRVPEFFFQQHYAESDEALIARHRAYNQIVREVAAEKKAELLDLDATFNQRNKDELILADGVHPNRRGRHLIAEMLTAQIGRMGILSPDDRKRIAENLTYDSTDPNVLRSRIEILGQPLRVTVGQPLDIAVRAANTGDTIWLASSTIGYGYVRLEVIIRDSAGKQLFEKESGQLPRDVRPGETVEVRWTLGPFGQPGRYGLDVAGVAEYVAWFKETGDKETTTPLVVEERKP